MHGGGSGMQCGALRGDDGARDYGNTIYRVCLYRRSKRAKDEDARAVVYEAGREKKDKKLDLSPPHA